MTLIEMLIVLAIIGIVAGAATIGIGAASRPPSAEAEARRLAERIQLAADDVMVDDRGMALTWDRDGYGFVVRQQRGWAADEGEAFAWHKLPGGMELAGARRGLIPIGSDGSAQPLALTLRSGAGSWVVRYDGIIAKAVPVTAS